MSVEQPSTSTADASGSPAAAEFSAKHARLVRILEDRGVDALLLTSTGALAWLLVGARVHISLAGPPILTAVVHREGVEIGVFTNEAARIRDEELGALLETSSPRLRLHELPWHEDLEATSAWLPGSAGWELLDEASAALQLRAARAELLPTEIERYRALCTDAAVALTDVLSEVTPETTERELAAALGPRILDAGADPVVLLVSGASRAAHRHPLPTEAALGHRAMAVVCARRGGLIANVTRWVGFEAPRPGEAELDAAISAVEADAFQALVPGAELASVLQELQRAYPRHGFDAQEWTRHHQGGAAGYQGRDPRLSPGVADLIHPNQAFALNPTGFDTPRGLPAKVEDTVVLRSTDSASTWIDVLSVDPRWPTVEVAGRPRPGVLRR
ncbi:M24 family metallopeptidase [Nesterenkonia sandarakina]|uniref:Xaa-Pro aminopeptidase n=1 Tax=Nesterenkonia sandarakina TaxID=272918 RepID=A0A7Z0E7I6_9MICC|nr:M24 family metallopeptidase [Nesterenkonia sandarakina]NYJ16348.1 Xaa-Pro aminopeptidase [Nesterenkonia sandarakina]